MTDFPTRDELYAHLESSSRVLQTDLLKKAFKDIDRKDFVPEDYEVEAYEDYPLPIGFDQTISQPTTVGFMLELLDPKEGESVLDIGSGSGWTTALLSVMVGKSGHVLGLERIPELVIQGDLNLKKYDFTNAVIELAGKEFGRPEMSFDRILVSAEADQIPPELIKQLRPGGTLVIPVKGSIYSIKKDKKGNTTQREFPGFIFVPLIK